jgi:hypothetical protein
MITRKKKDISDKVRKNKFIFKTRREITPDESKKLRRTHGNVFDLVKKGRESLGENLSLRRRKRLKWKKRKLRLKN